MSKLMVVLDSDDWLFRLFDDKRYAVIGYLGTEPRAGKIGEYTGAELIEWINSLDDASIIFSNMTKKDNDIYFYNAANYKDNIWQSYFDDTISLLRDLIQYSNVLRGKLGQIILGSHEKKFYLRLLNWIGDIEYLNENFESTNGYNEDTMYVMICGELFECHECNPPYAVTPWIDFEFYQYDFHNIVYRFKISTTITNISDQQDVLTLTEMNWELNNKTGVLKISDSKEVQLKYHKDIDVRYLVFS